MPTARLVVNVSYDHPGSPGVNVWHARSGNVTPTDFSGAIEVLEDFYTGLAPYCVPSTRFHFDGEITGVGDDSETMFVTNQTWSIVGTNSGPALPPMDAVCFSWKTDVNSRSGRGRTFISPVAAAIQDSQGQIESATRAALVDLGEQLIADSQGLTESALGVYSRTQNVFRDFVAVSMAGEFASLRSRRD